MFFVYHSKSQPSEKAMIFKHQSIRVSLIYAHACEQSCVLGGCFNMKETKYEYLN